MQLLEGWIKQSQLSVSSQESSLLFYLYLSGKFRALIYGVCRLSNPMYYVTILLPRSVQNKTK